MTGDGHPFLINKGIEIDIILLVDNGMKAKVTLKCFKKKYVDDMIRIFHLSVQKTCIGDYSNGQIEAWIFGSEKNKWIAIFNA